MSWVQEIALLVGAPRVSRIQEIALLVGAPRVCLSDTRNSFACFCTHDHKCLQKKGVVVL